MFTKIIIIIDQNKTDKQIVFINNGFIEYVEVFEPKYHNQYINLDITEYEFLQS
jgi:hypothetical protein